MEKSKKQEKLSDNSLHVRVRAITNNVIEKVKADLETICNFADKFVSSQKDMSAEIADIVEKHF